MRGPIPALVAAALVVASCVGNEVATPSATPPAPTSGTVAAPSVAPSWPSPAPDREIDRYHEDLEDGWADDWEIRGETVAADGVLTVRGPAIAHYRFGGYWRDPTLRVRLRHVSGEVRLHYRVTWRLIDVGYAITGYEVALRGAQVTLARVELFDLKAGRDSHQLASAPLRLDPERWQDLRVEGHGGRIRVSIDGAPVIDVEDDHPLLEGSVGLEVPAGGHLELEEIEVSDHLRYAQTWRRTSGPEGAMVTTIVPDPRDPRTVFVGTGHTGFYVSRDAGTSWENVLSGLTRTKVSAIELAADGETVYIGHLEGGGGSRSTDGGRHWQRMRIGDAGHVNAFAAHPVEPEVVYAGVGSSEAPQHTTAEDGAYRSNDGGLNWERLPLGQRSVFAVRIAPSRLETVYAAGAGGVWRSDDGGRTWTDSGNGLAGDPVTDLLVHPGDHLTVYALQHVFHGPLFRTRDGGATWRQVLAGASALAAPPNDPGVLYAADGDGILRSSDGGDSWVELSRRELPGTVSALAVDPADPRRLFAGLDDRGVFLSSDGGRSWQPVGAQFVGDLSEALALDPGDEQVVYVGHGRGSVSKTTDGGSTWTLLGKVSERGVTSLAVHPAEPETVFAGTYEGVHRSRDGGRSWQPVNTGIADPRIISITVHPREPSVVFAGTGSSRPYSIYGGSGLYRSTDGGTSWRRALGLPSTAVASVAVSPSDPGIVYAAAMGQGVYRSSDRGATWAKATGDLANPFVYQVAVDPNDPGVVYAGTQLFYGLEDFRTYEDQRVVDGIYRSRDAGQTWELLREGWIENLIVDPLDGRTIYYNEHTERVWQSDDGGETWVLSTKGLVPLNAHLYVYQMAIHPTGRILYATTCGIGVIRNELASPED